MAQQFETAQFLPVAVRRELGHDAGAIFVFMLFFADSGERAVTQAMMMGTVTAVIAATVRVRPVRGRRDLGRHVARERLGLRILRRGRLPARSRGGR